MKQGLFIAFIFLFQFRVESSTLPVCWSAIITLERNVEPDEIFLKHADHCLERITKKARELDIIGAAAIAFIPGERSESWISKMSSVDKIASEKANYLAVAYSKLAEMAVTLRDSGEPTRKSILGEHGFIGGAIYQVPGGYIVGAFSGGSGEADLEAARTGLSWLSEQFD